MDEWYTDEVEMLDWLWDMVLRGERNRNRRRRGRRGWYGPDVRFNMYFDYGRDWEDNPFTWWAWAPGSPAQAVQASKAANPDLGRALG
ncbi:MAG: hypothetical protein R3E66_03030 [bacterium]